MTIREYAKAHGVEIIGKLHRKSEYEYETITIWDEAKQKTITKRRRERPYFRFYLDEKTPTPNEIYIYEDGHYCICGEDENGFDFCT